MITPAPAPAQEKRILHLHTKNISAGGAYLIPVTLLPQGSEVKTDLVIHAEKIKKLTGKQAHLSIRAKVLRTEAEGMAITFSKAYTLTSH